MKKRFSEDDDEGHLVGQMEVVRSNDKPVNGKAFGRLALGKVFKYSQQEEDYPLQIRIGESCKMSASGKEVHISDLRFLDNNNLIQKLFVIEILIKAKLVKTKGKCLCGLFGLFDNVFSHKVINTGQLEETLKEISDIISDQHNNLDRNCCKVVLFIDSFTGNIHEKQNYSQFSFMIEVKLNLYVIVGSHILFTLRKGMNYIYFPQSLQKESKAINFLPIAQDDTTAIITSKGLSSNFKQESITEPSLNHQLQPKEKDCVINLEQGNCLISTELTSL